MRTRFPPSPTGFLHVGGLRTALYSYLIAKKTGGQFIVRIEDTDQERSVSGAIENILRTLHWAGIDPDEGVKLHDEHVIQEGPHAPYIQSERLTMYAEHAQKLLEGGHAYPCFCSTERLEQMRNEQVARHQAPMYDRTCLRMSALEVRERLARGERHVVRFKMPDNEKIAFDDVVRERVEFQSGTLDDQILVKSDGFPTYHLANVVDDHLMEIDIVIRGEEWLSSTPKHLLLYRALNWTPPRFAHVPLLLNKDRTKLSKRQGDVAVEEYVAAGYLPEALLNFLALLGWNPGTKQEIFSLPELIEHFSLERVQKGGAIFDREKLDWLQGQWIRKLDAHEFAERIHPIVAERFPKATHDTDFERKTALIQERITFFREAPEMLGFFYEEPKMTLDVLTNERQKVTTDFLSEILTTLVKTLENVPDSSWSEVSLTVKIDAVVKEGQWSRGQLLWPLRAVLTGLPYSPGAYEVATVLGKMETINRLHSTLKILNSKH